MWVLLAMILPFWAWLSSGSPSHVWAYLLLINVANYACLAWDKFQALRQGWRVPEATLHGMELLGGWPGSYLAQRHWRHKTRKAEYQRIFWIIVMLYQIASLVEII